MLDDHHNQEGYNAIHMVPTMSSLMFAWSHLIGTAFAESPPWPYLWDRQPLGQSWDLGRFTTLVAFGDSYTDDNRFNYFDAHNYTPPPRGWAGSAVSRPLHK
jgi:hypothetical protein